MGAAPGWEEGELEFKLVFEEDPPPPPRGPSPCRSGERPDISTDGFQSATHTGQRIGIPAGQPSTNLRAGMHSPPPRRALVREYSGTYESLPARSIQVSESRVLECPSIQITTISPEEEFAPAGGSYWGWWGPSPASSPSSRGWLSPASSCDSLLVEEEELNEATAQFCLSPSSRPTSPGGKKRRNSPLPSPCTSGGAVTPRNTPAPLQSTDTSRQNQASPSSLELNIPQKTRKTSLGQVSPREVESDQAQLPGVTLPSTRPPCRSGETSPLWAWTTCVCLPPGMGKSPSQCPQPPLQGRTDAARHAPSVIPVFRSSVTEADVFLHLHYKGPSVFRPQRGAPSHPDTAGNRKTDDVLRGF
ncbi:hypothetical protein SKAU_G00287250 [Synaphobranchus kaupii]|uniref:Uncharacterized protein n=1 Tax=Synaphobranchus kaupii TaxID=118154 RepID=A0A9Q1EYG7_SYNKA|nr:hypothetical protein SKAU_G00287250 [Synaphobranchus kaupii]